MEIVGKIVGLIEIKIATTRISVRIREGETDNFIINKGLKKGDELSGTLCNLALEYVLRNRRIWYTITKREAIPKHMLMLMTSL